MVVAVGLTDTLPEAAPPVEKFVPEQVPALLLVHVSVEEPPDGIEMGFAVSDALEIVQAA